MIGPGWLGESLVQVSWLRPTEDESVQASLSGIDSSDFVLAGFIEFLHRSLVLAVARFLLVELSIHGVDAALGPGQSSNRSLVDFSGLCFEFFDPSVFSLKFLFFMLP